jgi:multiple sugar transport system ATP-binding protein
MDEPLSNLDAKLRTKTRAELKKLHEKLQTTFIYVTHDQTEALTLGDRIAVIDKGIIQQVDSPEVIYNSPANVFVGGFLGSPPMNFIKTEIQEGQISINGIKYPLSEEQKNKLEGRKNVILGIRAENFNDSDGELKFSANIKIIEMLGSKKIIYIDCNNQECQVEMPPEKDYDKKIFLSVKMNNILFFDVDTEKRIY